MDYRIDRSSQVSLAAQIKGIIEYRIGFGELQVGQALPSVRELAESFGVAPMTVSAVYRELKAQGLIETRPGAGTFVADSSQAQMAAQPAIASLYRQIDDLIERVSELGMRPGDLASLINARLSHRAGARNRVTLVMIGLFEDATASYAASIAAQVGGSATVEPVILSDIKADEALRQRVALADLVLTFGNTHREIAELLPSTAVVAIRFIPSEATRLSLASLDPLARVLAVSRFQDFLPILESGVRRFAAHLQTVTAINIDDERLSAEIAKADVVVLATGAEGVRERVPPTVRMLEYRHTPDPGDIERLVVPFVRKTADALNQNARPAADSKEEQ